MERRRALRNSADSSHDFDPRNERVVDDTAGRIARIERCAVRIRVHDPAYAPQILRQARRPGCSGRFGFGCAGRYSVAGSRCRASTRYGKGGCTTWRPTCGGCSACSRAGARYHAAYDTADDDVTAGAATHSAPPRTDSCEDVDKERQLFEAAIDRHHRYDRGVDEQRPCRAHGDGERQELQFGADQSGKDLPPDVHEGRDIQLLLHPASFHEGCHRRARAMSNRVWIAAIAAAAMVAAPIACVSERTSGPVVDLEGCNVELPAEAFGSAIVVIRDLQDRKSTRLNS